MYEINSDQLQKLKETLMHINMLTLTGSQNFILATNAFIKLQSILEDLEKKGISVIVPNERGT